MAENGKKIDWSKVEVDDRPVKIGRDGTDRNKVYTCKSCGKVLPNGTVCSEVFTYYGGDFQSSNFFCSDCY